jgi:hypothetical protein
MSQPLFSITDNVVTFNYPEIDLPQFTFTSSEVWSNGPTTLVDPLGPGGNIFAAPDILTGGTGLHTGTEHAAGQYGLTNNAWLIAEDQSSISTANITGTGDLTAIDSTIAIFGGQGATSETIGLINNSNLYLGLAPGMRFLSPIDIDASSTITIYGDLTGWASTLTSNTWGGLHASDPPDWIGHIAKVDSLTPGYTPRVEFQFGGPGNYTVTGITIVDTPIIAPHL